MDKKSLVILSSLIFAILLCSFLVSAQVDPVGDIKKLSEGIGQVISDLAEQILGQGPSGSIGGTDMSFLFARVLFLIIIFSVVWAVVKRMPLLNEHAWIEFLVAVSVSLLSTRFLVQPEWIQAILLPYSALGIAITAILPLIIYFFFVESIHSRTFRKIAWIFAGVVFIGLWYSRASELTGSVIYVYPIASLACLIMLILDGTITRAWNKITAENALGPVQYAQYGRLMRRIDELTVSLEYLPPAKAKTVQAQIDQLMIQATNLLAGTTKP